MGVLAKEKTEALLELVRSVHNGEERQIRQSLESLLTALALECDPVQVTTLRNFANSIKFDRNSLSEKPGGKRQIRANLTNYGYQLD